MLAPTRCATSSQPGNSERSGRATALDSVGAVNEVSVRRVVAATPLAAWRAVAELDQMGRWSPENARSTWIDDVDEPTVGARFRGINRRGPVVWTAVCEVVDCVPGEVFAFDARVLGIGGSRWTYTFAPHDDGCLVTETWRDDRASWWRVVGGLASGVPDREAHNRRTMTVTLDNLAAHLASTGA